MSQFESFWGTEAAAKALPANPPAQPVQPTQPANGNSYSFAPLRQSAAPLPTSRAPLPEAYPPVHVSSSQAASPAELGALLVDSSAARDARSPPIDGILGNSSQFPYSDEMPPFAALPPIDIPASLLALAQSAETITKTMLFAEIHTVCLIVDCRIYLWNYNDVTRPVVLQTLPHSVTALQLVKPKRNVFVPKVNFLFIAATTQHVHVLPVTHQPHKIVFHDFPLCAANNGLVVQNIVADTSSGRVFIPEPESLHIWELEYTNKDSWFGSHCRLTCRTRYKLQSLFFGFSGGSSGDLKPRTSGTSGTSGRHAIAQLCVDPSRHRLYALTTHSDILTYDTSSGGFRHVVSYTFRNLLANLLIMAGRSRVLTRHTRLVRLFAIPQQLSDRMCLVALTDSGCRIFLRSGTADFVPGYIMQAASVRFPPERAGESIVLPTSASEVFFGVFFFACCATDQNSALFLSAPSLGRNSANALRPDEFCQTVALPHPVLQVALESPPAPTRDLFNELAAQFSAPPLTAVVLTARQVLRLTRQRPFQLFQSLGPEAQRLGVLYGATELGIAALHVYCSRGTSRAEKLAAAQAVLHSSDGPKHLRFGTGQGEYLACDGVVLSGRASAIAGYLARILRPVWTRPVFHKVNSADSDDTANVCLALDTNFVADTLFRIAELLSFIDSVAAPAEKAERSERTEPAETVATQAAQAAQVAQVAQVAEQRAVDALRRLVRGIQEALEFCALLQQEARGEAPITGDSGNSASASASVSGSGSSSGSGNSKESLAALFAFVDPAIRRRLLAVPLRALAVDGGALDAAKALVKALVDKNIHDGKHIPDTIAALSRACPSFCSKEDALLFRANELLEAAKAVGEQDQHLKREKLTEAVQLFQTVAGEVSSAETPSVSYESIRSAIAELVQLRFFGGAVSFALSMAAALDPKGSAPSATSATSATPSAGSGDTAASQKRMDLYRTVFVILEYLDNAGSAAEAARDEAYAAVFAADDAVFLDSLCTWFWDRQKYEALLAFNSPFAARFLERRCRQAVADSVADPEKSAAAQDTVDLIWQYHTRRGNYARAVVSMRELAEDGSVPLTLYKRVELLSRARGFCSVAQQPAYQGQLLELASGVRDLLDVAAVQVDVVAALKEKRAEIAASKSTNGISGTTEPSTSVAQLETAISALEGPILPVSELYNNYAKPFGLHKLCLVILALADTGSSEEAVEQWAELFAEAYRQCLTDRAGPKLGFGLLAELVGGFDKQFAGNKTVFPLDRVLQLMIFFAVNTAVHSPGGVSVEDIVNHKEEVCNEFNWIADVFIDRLDGQFTCAELVHTLFQLIDYPVEPFNRKQYSVVAADLAIYVLQRWAQAVDETEVQADGVGWATAADELLQAVQPSALVQKVQGHASAEKVVELRKLLRVGS